MGRLIGAFREAPGIAWTLVAVLLLVVGSTSLLVASTADVRYERDVTRIVFNKNWQLLSEVRSASGARSDSLAALLEASPETPGDGSYLVVSLADRRLWYKRGGEVLFTTRVAVGSGKTLVNIGGDRKEWTFDTPRGRLVVQGKEVDPRWIPPDWHFIEVARKKGLGVRHLQRGQSITLPNGSAIAVAGNDVILRHPDGTVVPYVAEEGREIVVPGAVVIPPFGTNQRRYDKVLGTHRLLLGDGYALHGTNKPETIGQAVSHGCIRLRNDDIAYLHGIVEVGTPVFIY